MTNVAILVLLLSCLTHFSLKVLSFISVICVHIMLLSNISRFETQFFEISNECILDSDVDFSDKHQSKNFIKLLFFHVSHCVFKINF